MSSCTHPYSLVPSIFDSISSSFSLPDTILVLTHHSFGFCLGLAIGHSGNSETKQLGLLQCTIPKFSQLMIIDSPGFDDTEGVENDIANYASIAQTLRCCATVRPVLLINCQGIDADRGQRLKSLLGLVLRFFTPIEEHLENISVLFTHCSLNDSKDVSFKSTYSATIHFEQLKMI